MVRLFDCSFVRLTAPTQFSPLFIYSGTLMNSSQIVSYIGDAKVGIKCEVLEHTNHTVWYHNGAILYAQILADKECSNKSGVFRIRSVPPVLLICNLVYSHAGVYTCGAGGSDEQRRNTTLIIKGIALSYSLIKT